MIELLCGKEGGQRIRLKRGVGEFKREVDKLVRGNGLLIFTAEIWKPEGKEPSDLISDNIVTINYSPSFPYLDIKMP